MTTGLRGVNPPRAPQPVPWPRIPRSPRPVPVPRPPGAAPARLSRVPQPAPDPALRASDADREAMAVALSEHFAQGRLTLDELRTRLSAALTATTYGDLAEVVRDLA